MTNEFIAGLADPKRGDYDEKTCAAVAYAREWALTRGEVKNAELIAQFENHYSADDRETIIALIQIMDFANRFNNSWTKPMDTGKFVEKYKA